MANGPYYVDQALTTFSQAYRNQPDKFISEKLFPDLPVDFASGIYWEYNRENLKKPVDTTRTGHGKTPVATYSKKKKNFGPLQEHDLKTDITRDEYKMTQNPLDPEMDAVNFLNEQMSIEKESKLSALLSNTSVITQNAAPATQWNAATGAGHPFLDIETGIIQQKKYGLISPNTIFMGYEVWSQLKNHPDLLTRVQYSQLAAMTTGLFKDLFADNGIANILVGEAVADVAAEGVTASNSFLWGKNLWLGYISPTPGLRAVNGGYTLTLKDGKYVDRWDDQDEKVTWIRNNDYYEQKLVGPEAFYMITGAVA